VETSANLLVNVLLPLVPWFLIFAFIWFFVFRQLRRAQPGEPKPAPVYIVTPENR
jgi:preprotein translocase subunit YajC